MKIKNLAFAILTLATLTACDQSQNPKAIDLKAVNTVINDSIKKAGDKADNLQLSGESPKSIAIEIVNENGCQRPKIKGLAVVHAGCFDVNNVALVLAGDTIANAKAGFVNESGKVVVPFVYDVPYTDSTGAYQATVNDGMIAMARHDVWGYVDLNGVQVIDFEYDFASPFFDGMAVVGKDSGDGIKWGYIDKTGKIIGNIDYDVAHDFQGGLAKVGRGNETWFINPDGKTVIGSAVTARYDDVSPAFSENLTAVTRKGGLGFIDIHGTEVVPLHYQATPDDYPQFVNGKAQVSTRKGKTLCINVKNQRVNC